MKRNKSLPINYLLSALWTCICISLWVPPSTSKEHSIKDVSLIQLISNPDAYDGRMVRVCGCCEYSFGSILYLSRESADFHITQNAIWFVADSKTIAEPLNKSEYKKLEVAKTHNMDNGKGWQEPLAYFDYKVVEMEGIFRSGKTTGTGHGNMFKGELSPVKRILERRKVR